MNTRIVLGIFFATLTQATVGHTQEFIEAQMRYLVQEDGTKSFQATWDESEQTLQLKADLVWD